MFAFVCVREKGEGRREGEREERGKQGRDRKEGEMVGANLKAETMAMMESRTAVEAEMDAIIARLSRPGGAGLQGNLVDSEVHSSQLFFFFFFFYSFASSSTPLPTLLLLFSLRIGLRERERKRGCRNRFSPRPRFLLELAKTLEGFHC